MTLNWIEALAPAAAIAILVRVVARNFGPYFSWVEMLNLTVGEMEGTKQERRVAMIGRLVVPFVVMFVLGVALPDTYLITDGAVLGALSASLIVWPTVFHGVPFGVAKTDWLLIPIYGSFLVLFALSGFFGMGAGQAVVGAESPLEYLAENGGTAVLTLMAATAASYVYDRSSAALGKGVDRRRLVQSEGEE